VRRVRLGVIGLGAVAQAVHLPLLRNLRHLFEVTAVCDLSAGLVRRVAARFGLGRAARFRSAEELLDSGLVDAVLVLTSGSHGPLAGAALGRGLPVFCEKPLAYTLAEADTLERLAAKEGTPLQLGYMKLYDPAVRRAHRELVAARPALRAVDVTVLHPSGPSQLAHANLEQPPDDVSAATLAALGEETAQLQEQALGPAPAELRRLYTDVLLGSLVHDLAVVRLLAGDLEQIDHVDLWPEARGRRSLSRACSAAARGSACAGTTWTAIPPTARRSACTTSGDRSRSASRPPTCSTPRPC
jgi:myo-inositol 2-dehydrogenase / D-chiro-inositol 1-dehydrogenase